MVDFLHVFSQKKRSELVFRLFFWFLPNDVLVMTPDFRHILCPSRVISFCFGIFPCLWVRKCLKTANFAFLWLSTAIDKEKVICILSVFGVNKILYSENVLKISFNPLVFIIFQCYFAQKVWYNGFYRKWYSRKYQKGTVGCTK